MKTDKLLKKEPLFLDGALGSEIMKLPFYKAGDIPELLNLTAPEEILKIHKSYVKAGSDIVYSNTFGANSFKVGDKLKSIVEKGVELAKQAGAAAVALDIGPLGKFIDGEEFTEENAYEEYKKIISFGQGADLIVLETFMDLSELKTALRAARDTSDLPVFISMSFTKTGRSLFGDTIADFMSAAAEADAAAAGINCSLSPKEIYPLAEELVKNNRKNLKLFIKPNAGAPYLKDGKTVYDTSPEEFADDMERLSALGIKILGGCCGTSPEFIKELFSRFFSV